jgi:hypothetical protein
MCSHVVIFATFDIRKALMAQNRAQRIKKEHAANRRSRPTTLTLSGQKYFLYPLATIAMNRPHK